MRREEAIPTNFIRATVDGFINLPGNPDSITVTLSGEIKTHAFDDGKLQRVIRFRETGNKELGLNATNWDSIARISGKPDDEEWGGTVVELFVVPESKSKTGHAIRVRKPRGNAFPVKPLVDQAKDAFGATQPAVIGKAGSDALFDRLKTAGATLDQVRGWLTHKKVEPGQLVVAHPDMWPLAWVETIKLFLADPATCREEVAKAGVTIKDDDIPF